MEEKYTIDNIEYIVIDEIIHNNNKYIYLANINNAKDFIVRKAINDGKDEYLIGLDDEKELNTALMLLVQKNGNLLRKTEE